MYKFRTEITNYKYWVNYPYNRVNVLKFPNLYTKITGLTLPNNWQEPNLAYITKPKMKKLISLGFTPDEENIEETHSHTGLALPLVIDGLKLYALKIAYKARNRQGLLKWINYTLPGQSWQEGGKFVPSGAFESHKDIWLVDNLPNYFKLIGWTQCKRGIGIRQPIIVYIENDPAGVIETLRKTSYWFGTFMDLTQQEIYKTIIEMATRDKKKLHTKKVVWFNSDVMNQCQNFLRFQDAVTWLSLSMDIKQD